MLENDKNELKNINTDELIEIYESLKSYIVFLEDEQKKIKEE